MNILILGQNRIHKVNWGHQLFLNEFSKHHKVLYWGYDHDGFDENLSIPQVIEKHGRPDIIFTYMAKRCYHFKGLEDIVDIPKVHYDVDILNHDEGGKFFNYSSNRYKDFFSSNKFCVMFTPFVVTKTALQKLCDKVFLLPFSVDIDIYKKEEEVKVFDVMASFRKSSKIYPNRKRTIKMLRSNFDNVFTNNVRHRRYVKAINMSKICVTNNNIFKAMSMRYTEVLACGTFLLADLPNEFDYAGFKDKEHLVLYEDSFDLKDKVKYYLENEEERELIALKGMTFVRENHSNEVRVKQFTEILKKEIYGGKI
jgi:spore maturation protein CgeB